MTHATKNHVVLKRIETRRIASRFGRTRIYASRQDGVAPTLLLLQPIILRAVGTLGRRVEVKSRANQNHITQEDFTQIFPYYNTKFERLLLIRLQSQYKYQIFSKIVKNYVEGVPKVSRLGQIFKQAQFKMYMSDKTVLLPK